MGKFVDPFWVTATVIITVLLGAYLFPLLLAKHGLVSAILWALLGVFAMFLAYVRGYWVSEWLAKSKKTRRPASDEE